MLKTVEAVVREGQIKLLEPVDMEEGTRVLVTLLSDDEARFWLGASQASLDRIWDNSDDDVYAQLLEE